MQPSARATILLVCLSVGGEAARQLGRGRPHAPPTVLAAAERHQRHQRHNATGPVCDDVCKEVPPEFHCEWVGTCDGCPTCQTKTAVAATTQAPSTTTSTTSTKPPYAKLIQMGHFTLKNSYAGSSPNVYSFALPFEEPPVIIILASTKGKHPAAIRVRDVTTSGFVAWITEPPKEDGPHVQQDVSYLAAAPGVHALPDGRRFEVGKLSTTKQFWGKNSKCMPAGAVDDWEFVQFAAGFTKKPALLTGIQTMMNEQANVPKAPSKPFLTVQTKALQQGGAMVSLGRVEAGDKGLVALHEVIGWIAFEPGLSKFTGALGAKAECAAVLSDEIVEGWDDKASTVPLGADLKTPTPLVVGSMSSSKGSDGGWLRLKGASAKEAEVVVDEDRSCDKERKHKKEVVSLFACNVPFTL